jgi:MATE family, multidrug efflux pump
MQSPRALTEGSISRGLLKFSLPILFANVLQSLNGSVNSIWVGRFLGEAALTATSVANTIMFLLIAIAFGVAMAASILIGQHVGANDIPAARRAVGTSCTFFAAISVVMAITGFVISEPILLAMKTPPDSLPLAIAYMRVIFLALPCLYMYAFVMAVLRGAGDSKTPFYFMLLSVALDIGLNPVFIFGIGPIPRLGIAGSALATFVSQAVSLTALVRHLYRRRHLLVLHREQLSLLRPDPAIVATLVKKGIPMSAQMLVMALNGVIMITLVDRFGVDTAAAYGAALQLWNYIIMPALAVGMGVSTMAAQNVGAQKWDRVASVARVGVAYALAMTGLGVLLLEVFQGPAYSLFLPAGSAAMDVASHLNRIATPSFLFFGITMVLFGVVRATGAVIAPLIFLTIALLGLRVPLAAAFTDRLGADSIWWSFPISSACATIMAILYYKYGGWRSAHMQSSASGRLGPQVAQRQIPQSEGE